jgi:hypothetical protein
MSGSHILMLHRYGIGSLFGLCLVNSTEDEGNENYLGWTGWHASIFCVWQPDALLVVVPLSV